MMEDWLKTKTDIEVKIMKKWARISRIISISSTFIVFLAVSTLLILPWLGFSLRVKTNVEGLDDRFAMQSYYFYNMSKTSHFAFTYFMQMFALLTTAYSLSVVDSYLALLVFHICGQLQNLNRRLLKLNEFKDFRYAISYCVQEHIRLLRSINIIDNSFNLMFLMVILYLAVLFCFQGFIFVTEINGRNLSIGRTVVIIFSVIFTMGHFCVFCIVGEILVTQLILICYCLKHFLQNYWVSRNWWNLRLYTLSHTLNESIYYTAYDFQWYELKPQDAKCLIYLMIRANKPVYITAGKQFPMRMSTFCSLLKTSAGYISVLLANQN